MGREGGGAGRQDLAGDTSGSKRAEPSEHPVRSCGDQQTRPKSCLEAADLAENQDRDTAPEAALGSETTLWAGPSHVTAHRAGW